MKNLSISSQKCFCVSWKKNQSTFPTDIVEMESNFKYEETQINNDVLKQVIEYKLPISYEMNCLYIVFAFDLETCNVEYSEYCESYAAGVYHLIYYIVVLMEI